MFPAPPFLFSLLNPVLQRLPHISDLVVNVLYTDLPVDLGKRNGLLDTLAQLDVRLGHGGELLLVLPRQVGGIPHRDGQHGPAGADAQGEGHGGAQHNVAVAGDDAAGHGGDEDVDGAGHELLAALTRGRQGGDCAGEGLLEVKGRVDGLVDLVLGGDGDVVEEQARAADLDGEAVGRGRRPGRLLVLVAVVVLDGLARENRRR